MVKFDASLLRYMSVDEFRVLTAVEMGMKNHAIVPTPLICKIAGLKNNMAFKVIKLLHKNKLIYHDAKKYDGYKLTYSGYDYLALKAFVKRGIIAGVGRKIGVGKESDIYEVGNAAGELMCLKIHRLGRISFRKIKEKRDYLLNRTSASWLYMSRLAATREYAYMQALYDHGFPVPVPIDQNRHCVIMSKVAAYPFTQVRSIADAGAIYEVLMNLIVRLAEHGLIHCDFNEFNLMLSESNVVTMIDFPQMVSTSHRNAKMYFDRDVNCIRIYFEKKFKFYSEQWPSFFKDTERKVDLDAAVSASGAASFTKEERLNFEEFIRHQAVISGELISDDDDDDDDDEDDDDEEDGEDDGAGDGDDDDAAKVEKCDEGSNGDKDKEVDGLAGGLTTVVTDRAPLASKNLVGLVNNDKDDDDDADATLADADVVGLGSLVEPGAGNDDAADNDVADLPSSRRVRDKVRAAAGYHTKRDARAGRGGRGGRGGRATRGKRSHNAQKGSDRRMLRDACK
jgi:RIO kinase 2